MVERPTQDDLTLEPPTPDVRPHPDSAWMETFGEVIEGRRSVRRFTGERVDPAITEAVLQAGIWAPSPHGTQPWRFALLTTNAGKTGLMEAMAVDWRRNLELDGESEDVIEARLEGSRRRMRDAGALIVVNLYTGDLDRYPDPQRATAERTMAIQSLGACVQNMLLAAFAHGIDGGWMCAPLFCPDIVRDHLGLASDLEPHALIALGHAAADPRRRKRRSLETLLVYDDRT